MDALKYLYNFRLTEFVVYDADTVKVKKLDIGLRQYREDVSCRLYGIDSPEIRTRNKLEKKAGYLVRDYVADLCEKAIVVWARSYKQKGKYPRLIIDLMADGTNINNLLLEKKYVKEYYGGTKMPWTDKQLNKIIEELS